jgi:gamma-polyglutamate biosynthesis protein CapC
MMDVLPMAIGLGLVSSLLLSELLGVASAGMVVPGYLALYLNSPLHLISTLTAAFATYLALRLAGRFLIVYGRRRTALAILLGYLTGAACAYLLARYVPGVEPGANPVVGYIIPGLIAIWMDRQGVVSTLVALTICSSLVRLVLLLLLGAELPGVEGLL